MFILPFLVCPRRVDLCQCTSETGDESSGRKASCPNPGSRPAPSLEKIWLASQENLPQARIADSSSRNAVSFSSAAATRRFPLSRCASAIRIVRSLESIAERQPQLQPALLRLSVALLVVVDDLRPS